MTQSSTTTYAPTATTSSLTPLELLLVAQHAVNHGLTTWRVE